MIIRLDSNLTRQRFLSVLSSPFRDGSQTVNENQNTLNPQR